MSQVICTTGVVDHDSGIGGPRRHLARMMSAAMIGVALLIGLAQPTMAQRVVSVAPDQYEVVEGNIDITVKATLESPATAERTVPLTFEEFGGLGGGLELGSDYTVSANQIVIEEGDTTGTMTISIREDSDIENDEQILMRYGFNGQTPHIIFTIRDNDHPLLKIESLTTDKPTVTEGETEATVTLTLSAPATATESFYLNLGGNARRGVDYTAPTPHRITIAEGQSSATYKIAIHEDTITERAETIDISVDTRPAVSRSKPLDDSAANRRTRITIEDDDKAPAITSLTVNGQSETSVTEGDTDVKVELTLAKPATETRTFDLTISSRGKSAGRIFPVSAATAGEDYSAPAPQQITVAKGERSGTYTISVREDTFDEPSEAIVIATEVSDDTAQITINDNDVFNPAGYRIQFTRTVVSEGDGEVTFKITRPKEGFPATLLISMSGTAGRGSDYTGFNIGPNVLSFLGNFLADQTEVSGTFKITQDAIDEPDETVVATAAVEREGARFDIGSTTVTIRDDDGPAVQSLTARSAPPPTEGGEGRASAAAEGNTITVTEAATDITLTLTLADKATYDSTYPLTFAGTATPNSDYTAVTDPVITVAAGQRTGTLTFPIVADSVVEANETITVSAGGGDDPATATITIQNDDKAPLMSLKASETLLTESNTNVTFTLTLAKKAASKMEFQMMVGGSALPGEDFTPATPRRITVGAQQTQGKATIAVKDDDVAEEAETIKVSVGAGDNTKTETVTIKDNDGIGVRSITATPARVSENGQTVDIVVTYDDSIPTARTVPISFGGTATPGVDYTGAPLKLDVPGSALSSRFRLTMRPDSAREDDETIRINILGAFEIVTIIDEDTGIALLDEVRQQAGAALLRRNVNRFAFVTNNVVVNRLAGRSTNAVSDDGRKVFVDIGATLNAVGQAALRPQDRAGARDRPVNVWASIEATRLAGNVGGEVFDIHAGADYKLSQDVLVGVLVTYETADVDTRLHDGGLKADGWSLGAYAGVQLAPELTWDIAGSYGRQSPDVYARAGANSFFGSYTSNRWLVSSHLTGHVALDDGFIVKPTLGVVYGRDEQGTLTSQSGETASGRTLQLGRLSAGPRIDYSTALPDGWGWLDVTASATGQYDFLQPEEQSAADDKNRLSGAVALGLAWTDQAGTSIGIDGSIDGLGLEGYDAYNVTGKLKLDF